MRTRSTFLRGLLGTALSLCLAVPASAEYSQLIAFGDSLSDTGNLYALTSFLPDGGTPGSPYYDGRFSNGFLAVESMGFGLGLNVTSYAYGGAQTGMDNGASILLNGTGVAGQIKKFETTLPSTGADNGALYFLWAGADDFYAGNMMSPTAASTAAANMLNNVKSLFNDGARNFFVPLLPDLSLTPSALGDTPAFRAAAALRTHEYNTLLGNGLHELMAATPGMKVTVFDTPAFISKTIPDLVAAHFDITTPCFNKATQDVCRFQDLYLFWDDVHPSAAGHWMLGQAFSAAASVPEPDALYMVAGGMLLVLGRRRMATAGKRRQQGIAATRA